MSEAPVTFISIRGWLGLYSSIITRCAFSAHATRVDSRDPERDGGHSRRGVSAGVGNKRLGALGTHLLLVAPPDRFTHLIA